MVRQTARRAPAVAVAPSLGRTDSRKPNSDPRVCTQRGAILNAEVRAAIPVNGTQNPLRFNAVRSRACGSVDPARFSAITKVALKSTLP
jgi:hypothetical protein